MKICTLTNVYNSEEYLWYVLKSIYHFSDQLVIIDGAFNAKMPSPVSTDKTDKIVRSFSDHQRKIKYERGPAKTQLEQRGKVFKYLKGFDWLMIVDDDEVYRPEELRKLRNLLAKARRDAYKIGGFTFFNSFDWYRWVADPRIWRVKPEMRFVGSNNLVGKGANYDRNKMPVIEGITKYHYSYVRNPRRLKIRKNQAKVKYPYKVKGKFFVRENISWKKFSGQHPKIMERHPYRKIKWNPKN